MSVMQKGLALIQHALAAEKVGNEAFLHIAFELRERNSTVIKPVLRVNFRLFFNETPLLGF